MTGLKSAAGTAASAFKHYVEEGPQGVQMLSFFSGLFTTVVGILGILDVFGAVFSPFWFLINLYIVVFGAVTALVECDVDRLATIPVLEFIAPKVLEFQKCANEEAKFLTL